MHFQIDLHSGKPIYQQLIDQVKQALATGRLQPGDRLPPIRELAVQLRVNRNTIARVYTDLEREGLIYTRAGQGAFASDRAGVGLKAGAIREEVSALLAAAVAQAKVYRLDREALERLVTDVLDQYYATDVEKRALR